MGLFDSADAPAQRQDQIPVPANDGPLDKLANSFVNRVMDIGIDGVGPLDSAAKVAADARRRFGTDTDRAVRHVVATHVRLGGAAGFATGVGGVITMPVSLPANVLGFYALATRMVTAIADLRGYDVTTAGARSAVLLTLVGADADDLLRKAGVGVATGMTGSGRIARIAMSKMPRAAGMMVNKAVGFRILTQLGARALSRFVRFVPIAGGIVGAGLDGLLMKRIADQARREFVPVEQVQETSAEAAPGR